MRAASLLLVAAAGPARADGLQPGLWKLVTTTSVNGMAAPPRQTTRCLTAEAVKDLDKTFSPMSRTTNSECKRVEHESTPQQLKWRLKCTGQLDMDVAGDFRFAQPDHYTASVVASSSMLGQRLQDVHTEIDARRIGACP